MCDCEIQEVSQPVLAQWLEYIESIFLSLTIGECLDILMDLGHQRARYRGADGVLADLRDLYEVSGCLNDPGDTFYVEFLGGPPTESGWGTWYRGTLITWVVDGLLYDFTINNGDIASPIIEECEAFINDTDGYNDDDEDDEMGEYDAWEAGYGACEIS